RGFRRPADRRERGVQIPERVLDCGKLHLRERYLLERERERLLHLLVARLRFRETPVGDERGHVRVRFGERQPAVVGGGLTIEDNDGGIVVPVDRRLPRGRRFEPPRRCGTDRGRGVKPGRCGIDDTYVGGRAVGQHRI